MSGDLKKHFCPRLIDFVIIVGCKEPATPLQIMAKQLHKQQQAQKQYEQSLPPEHRQAEREYREEREREKQAEAKEKEKHSSNVPSSPTQPALAQMPELLRRYPLDDHSDFMLPQDVTYFCQPEGCSNINCASQQRANVNRDTTSFIFSLTEKDSARVR